MFFSTLVAVKRPGQALITAFRAEIGFWLVYYRSAAARTEFGIGRQVFSTAGTLLKNDLLMATMGTKF
jgi:hypothetical protein